MATQVDKIVKIYKTLAQVPALLGARITASGTTIHAKWSQRNLERGKCIKFIQSYIFSNKFKKINDTVPIDISTESLSSISPSEKYRAVIREIDTKEGRKHFLEIWQNQHMSCGVNLTALDIHGDVYIDGEFGTLEWSPDETKLLFIAEKKSPKTEPFMKRKQPKKENKDELTNEEASTSGEEHLFTQDWGEQLVGKKNSLIVEYNMESDTFRILEGIPEGSCPGQLIWAPDGSYIVGVVYYTLPRKLGLTYCSNRPSAVFSLDLDGKYEILSDDNKAVTSPRFSLDGKTVIWLERNVGGPHHGAMTLVKRKMPFTTSDRPTIVVDVVQKEITINGGKLFHGLFNSGFPKRCWASDSRILISTNQKNTINTYVIDLDSGKITELEYANGSQIVLDVNNDMVLVNRRSFLTPDKLAVGHLPAKENESLIEFHDITQPQVVQSITNNTFYYLDLKHSDAAEVDTFTAMYIGPKDGPTKHTRLIVWPHGGPHSSFANFYFLELALFLSTGHAVLLINYRGSLGAGEASIKYLLGKIGCSDVSDCMLATQTALEKFEWLNPEQVALVGGSHGGFLVTHLSGQYPTMFKVVVARNPVIDVASMSITSDIPDWCYVECGKEYTQVGPPSEDLLLNMRRVSPIQHAHKVRAPTLLQVGCKDLRVPPTQAMEYYHRLKANGVQVRMNVYEDNHPLSLVPNELDNLINTVLWLQQHME